MQQNTITETPKSVTITTADIDRLIAGIAGVRTAAGRTVVHGLYFDTDAESITDNVLATVEIRLIRNWAHPTTPLFRGTRPGNGSALLRLGDFSSRRKTCVSTNLMRKSF